MKKVDRTDSVILGRKWTDTANTTDKIAETDYGSWWLVWLGISRLIKWNYQGLVFIQDIT